MESKKAIQKKTLIFFAVLLLVFALGAGFGAFSGLGSLVNKTLPPEEILVDIEIDYGEENRQVFREEIFWQGSDVLETLKALERRHGVSAEIRDLSGGEVLVEGINGVRNTRNSFWQVSINGGEFQNETKSLLLENDDKILWRRVEQEG